MNCARGQVSIHDLVSRSRWSPADRAIESATATIAVSGIEAGVFEVGTLLAEVRTCPQYQIFW